MATAAKLNTLKKHVKIKFGAFEMATARYKEQPTPENKFAYWKASDMLEDKLSEYYAACIMYYKIHDQEMYEIYINKTKDEATDMILNRIVKKRNILISQQFKDKKIDEIEFKINALKSKKKPIPAIMQQQLQELKKRV